MSSTLLESSDPTDLEQLTEDKLFPPYNTPETEIDLPPSPTTEQETIYLEQKERAMKSKIIALEHMGKHPLTNPSSFSRRDKDRLLKIMREWFDKTDEELNAEFNDVVVDKVLNETSDYQNYSIANNAITYPEPPPKNIQYDIAMNTIELDTETEVLTPPKLERSAVLTPPVGASAVPNETMPFGIL
jgi:hypothetical protein